MPVTLQTIAKQCGVDVSTASRALRGDKRVKPETQALVRSVAEGLGYKPNLAARSLQSGKTNTAWFVIPSLTNTLERAMAEPAGRFLWEKQYDMLVALSHHDRDAYDRILERLGQGAADGALMIAESGMDATLFRSLVKKRFPMVFLDRYVEGVPFPVIANANYDSAEHLVKQCLEQQSEEFVVIMPDSDTAGRARLKGCITQLEKNNMPYHIIPIDEVASLEVTCQKNHVAIIGNSQSLIQDFMQAHKNAYYNKRLVYATYDQWQGEPEQAEVIYISVQNFQAMAKAAVSKLYQILDTENYKPVFEQIEISPLKVEKIQRTY